MFTGIIESIGTIEGIEIAGTNKTFTISAAMSAELKVDQSVAHNGCCLTVDSCEDKSYTVTAIKETIDVTSLSNWKVGDQVNLERCLKVGDRLDGHFVQGHVDQVATCQSIVNENGSWHFTFSHAQHGEFRNVSKGSITVNGVSLTVVNPSAGEFSVAIIPYTYEHTNFGKMKVGDFVNIEFDVLGKYIAEQVASRSTSA